MKIFIVGGTGLLGSEAVSCLINNGHEVTTVALPPLPLGADISEKVNIVFADIMKLSDSEIESLLDGVDVFIFAAGVDERVEFKAPVLDYYKKYNIAPLERIFPLCKKKGVKRAIVFGSYFSYLAKKYPLCKYAQKHQYIKSRILQEEICEKHCNSSFSVTVLELPYIFGTQPGRKPVWTILIEQIAFMDNWPFTMYPKGGTAMLTTKQVGQVVCGAAEKETTGFHAVPIGMYNMKWKEFLSYVYAARNMDPNRKIISIPSFMMKLGMLKPLIDYKKRKVEPGISPMKLPQIMNTDLFIDPSYAIELGAKEDDIVSAISDSIKVSCEVYNGKTGFIDMKCE